MKAMTGRILLRLSVLSLTFFIGCLVQFSLHRSEVSHAPVYQPGSTKFTAPPGWRKVTIGNVSFYVPPGMKPLGNPGNVGGISVLHSVDGDFLYLFYAYGPTVSAEVNVMPSRPEQAIVCRKPASITKWEQRDGLTFGLYRSGIQLVIKDVGDGNKFELYLIADDLTIGQKVIDTIEIH